MTAPSLDRVTAARAVVAQLVLRNPVFGPVFERLDREARAAEQAQVNDPVARARALLEQRHA